MSETRPGHESPERTAEVYGGLIERQTPANAAGHHPQCYQNTGVPDDMPPGLCDCRVLRMIEREAGQ